MQDYKAGFTFPRFPSLHVLASKRASEFVELVRSVAKAMDAPLLMERIFGARNTSTAIAQSFPSKSRSPINHRKTDLGIHLPSIRYIPSTGPNVLTVLQEFITFGEKLDRTLQYRLF